MPSHLDATGRIPIPHDLPEANASLARAEREVKDIERQLEDPTRLVRVGEVAYDKWRKGAKVALGKWCIEVHQLKEWIAENEDPEVELARFLDEQDAREYLVEPTAAEKEAENFWRDA